MEQGVQGLQVFAFRILTVKDEHPKPRFKRKRSVKYKDGLCVKLCLKLWFESDWYFCNITVLGFESNSPETKFQTITS